MTRLQTLEDFPVLYRGSVKNVRDFSPNELIFQFTDRYSVFDWGGMPQEIPGKGRALTLLGAVLFERLSAPEMWREFFLSAPQFALGSEFAGLRARLESEGLRTHYRGLVVNESGRWRYVPSWGVLTREEALGLGGMIVQRIEVRPPSRRSDGSYDYFGQTGFSTPAATQGIGRLLALEVVFRHGVTQGSSILERRRDLKPGERFETPLIEFFTKLEPRDRHLEAAEALEVSGLTSDRFSEWSRLNQLVAAVLRAWFGEEELHLIDGKLEWALLPSGEFMLVDSIGPDELRLETRDGVELSKEVFRRFYRTTAWYEKVKEVKARIDASGESSEEWQSQVEQEPPRAPAALLDGFSGALRALCARLSQRDLLGAPRLEKIARDLGASYSLKLERGSVLVLGNGAREHALAWKLLSSEQVQSLFWYPGSDVAIEFLKREFSGKTIQRLSGVEHSARSVAERSRGLGIELTVIGPDQFLADGWADEFRALGLTVFGPSREASRLEWSKAFAKEVMREAGAPTAKSFTLRTEEELRRFVGDWNPGVAPLGAQVGSPLGAQVGSPLGAQVGSPLGAQAGSPSEGPNNRWVLKADGLALGKGVLVAPSSEEALRFGKTWLDQGQTLLVEEFLEGEEVSFFAFCDGETAAILDPARDYKTLREWGQGPNTGGMGAISPVRGFGEAWKSRILNEVFIPVLRTLRARGTPYTGMLYAGLMVRGSKFWVLEFNARFGDPEAQVLLPRMKGDLVPWLVASARGRLSELGDRVPFVKEPGAYVVLASPGYPEKPRTGAKILGVERVGESARIFLAGVTRGKEPGELMTSGGRVLGVFASAESASHARVAAYDRADAIEFEGRQIRRDVGDRARIVVLASGRGSNFEALVRASRTPGFSGAVVALISNREDAPVLEKARALGIPSQVAKTEKEILAAIREFAPDALVLAGFMKILSSEFLAAFRRTDGRSTVLNVHPSLLPELPGLHSYRRAYEERREQTGVTVHEVVTEVDAGPILVQEEFAIGDCRSVEEVEARGLAIEHRLFPKAIDDWLRAHQEGNS